MIPDVLDAVDSEQPLQVVLAASAKSTPQRRPELHPDDEKEPSPRQAAARARRSRRDET